MTEPDAADYPDLFRAMIVRSAQAALASIDSQAPSLADEVRDRCLYALRMALHLSAAWAYTRNLLLALAAPMRWQGYTSNWMNGLEQGIAVAQQQEDSDALAKLHHQLGWLYRQNHQWEQAAHHAQRAYELAWEQGDQFTQVDSLNQLVAAAVERSDFTAAKVYLDQVFQLTTPSDSRRAFAYSHQGFIAMQQGEWESAIHWYTESIRLHLAAGEHRLAAQSEQGLAFTYTYTKEYQKAMTHYQHVLATLEQYPSPMETATTQMEMGWLYWLMGEYVQSLSMYQQCEPVFVKLGNRLWLSQLYNNLGLTYMRIERINEAESAFAASIALSQELDLPRLTANALESLGRMYSEIGKLDRAIETWEQAFAELSVFPDPPQYLYDLILRRLEEVRGRQGNPAPGPPPPSVAA